MRSLAPVFFYAGCLAIAAVVASLFGGLVSMARGGDFNARWGNKLMRARLVSQASAIACIVLYVVAIKFG